MLHVCGEFTDRARDTASAKNGLLSGDRCGVRRSSKLPATLNESAVLFSARVRVRIRIDTLPRVRRRSGEAPPGYPARILGGNSSFSWLRNGYGCKFLLSLDLSADSSQQRSYSLLHFIAAATQLSIVNEGRESICKAQTDLSLRVRAQWGKGEVGRLPGNLFPGRLW